MSEIDYSIVIPVYNSERSVGLTVEAVREFFAGRDDSYEIVLVNDASPDGSWGVISELAREHDEVTAIDLLHNYGQHYANLCGFRHARGDWVVTMDDDLQNPPGEIAKLVACADDGDHDLVIGRFEEKRHSFVRRLGSRVVGWLNRTAFGIDDDLVLTNFRLVRRDVVDRVCRDRSASPYIPGLVLKFSRSRANVLVRHDERIHGASTYTMRKLVRLVMTILFNHSTLPLRIGAAVGFAAAAVSFLVGAFYLVRTLLVGTSAPGFPTIIVLMSFFNGMLIVLLSVIGEYLVRVLREQQVEQAYEVAEVVR